ncbi:MAG TPA: HisA/HisF-related TIM barrel protein [Methanomassiliicoccales archaeon]|nr:HisA/HisF-related TIM barrel protein [Methanomassiliicoccales archaeon]
MTERVVACQYCGSRRVVPEVIVGGPMAGVDNNSGRSICLDCGRSLVPLDFSGEEERQDFVAKTETEVRDFLHIPIVPVDTWSLFSLPIIDVPLVQVAKVVELEWQNGWNILPGGVPFEAYWKAVGSKRYGAKDVLIMDLAGMQHSRPNFDALKTLMKRKYSIWLEMGVREVHDIFDAFTLGSQNVLIGSMTCRSLGLLEEIIELSDQSIPLLYYDGEVRWGSKHFGPASLTESLDLLFDLGFDRSAVLDLRQLGSKKGFNEGMAEEAISRKIEVLIGGGVRESDLERLKEMGAIGGLLDPFTPVVRDLMASDRPDEKESPVPATVKRESPKGYALDA